MNTKQQNTSPEPLSSFQRFGIFAVCIAACCLSWPIFEIDGFVKLLLAGALCILIYSFVYSLSRLGELLNKPIHPWIAIIIAAGLFLVLPFFMRSQYKEHSEEYLVTMPLDGRIYVRISSSVNSVGGVGTIGNEITCESYLNGSKLSGDVIAVGVDEPFCIETKIVESDSIPDVGEAISGTYRFSENNNYKKPVIIKLSLRVSESGGNWNKGSYSDYEVVHTLNRVIPEMSFLDLYYYTHNAEERSLCEYAANAQIIFVAIAFIIIVLTAIKARTVSAKQKKERERILEEEKQAFRNKLEGMTIRQYAGVPSSIRFVNGLPVDNNDSQFGSFTVFRSSNGNCYHQKRGCCSARFPIHFFVAVKRYRPCSKCCYKHMEIPQWYVNYKRETDKANDLGLSDLL